MKSMMAVRIESVYDLFFILSIFLVTETTSLSTTSSDVSTTETTSITVKSSEAYSTTEQVVSETPESIVHEIPESTVNETPESKVHYWYKTNMSAQEYQNSFCFRGCLGEEKMDKSKHCPKPLCFPCDCEKPMCQIYGTCCPEISDQSGNVFITEDNIMKSNTSLSQNDTTFIDIILKPVTNTSGLKVTCAGQPPERREFLFIHSCPTTYMNAKVVEKCESQLPKNEQTVDRSIHVFDTETNVTYWNKYCAICNQVSKIVQWDVNIACKSFLKVYTATTYEEMFQLANRASECVVSQETPLGLSAKTCVSYWYGNAIGECNVTGNWLEYDEVIDNECRKNQDIFYKVYSDKSILYRNIFCFICNTNSFPRYNGQCPAKSPSPMENTLPFSLLFSFERKRSRTKLLSNVVSSPLCSHQEWPSPSNTCLPLACPPGKVLQGKNCSTAIPKIRGLGYYLHFFYLLKIVRNVRHHDEKAGEYLHTASPFPYLNAFKSKIKDTLNPYSKAIDLDFNVFNEKLEVARKKKLSKTDRKHDSSENYLVEIHGYVLSKKSKGRDDFESYVLSELKSKNFSIDVDGLGFILVTPFSYIFAGDAEMPCPSTLNCFSLSPYQTPCFLFVTDDLCQRMKEFLILTSLMTCAHVKFNTSEYILKSNNSLFPPSTQVVLNFNSDFVSHIDFETERELNQMEIDEDGTLKICEDLLRSKVSQIINTFNFDEDNASTMWMVQYILTLICVSLSMVCLFLTLLTYFLFPVLRNAAGQNNIFLCLTLLLAQASLLASSHVKGPSKFCTVLGMSTHFLWLSMFCWSFTCCWNMFRVFTAKTRKSRSARSERFSLIKKVIFCTLVPAITVVIVIVTITLTSNGQRIGYGDTICYLDSTLLVGVSMIAPIGLILLCNLFFFSLVVIKIHNVRKLQTHAEFKKEDKKNLYVYVKLSTLTGALWGLVIIGEVTENDTLRIISIVLNGFQGVFIFLSYVCNKRVLQLYLRAMGMENYGASASTQKSTLGKLASDVNPQEKMLEDSSVRGHSNTKPISEGVSGKAESEVVCTKPTQENCYVYDGSDTGVMRDKQNGAIDDDHGGSHSVGKL